MSAGNARRQSGAGCSLPDSGGQFLDKGCNGAGMSSRKSNHSRNRHGWTEPFEIRTTALFPGRLPDASACVLHESNIALGAEGTDGCHGLVLVLFGRRLATRIAVVVIAESRRVRTNTNASEFCSPIPCRSPSAAERSFVQVGDHRHVRRHPVAHPQRRVSRAGCSFSSLTTPLSMFVLFRGAACTRSSVSSSLSTFSSDVSQMSFLRHAER
jgi:hypothetical protein